jgi:hypothetical protein
MSEWKARSSLHNRVESERQDSETSFSISQSDVGNRIVGGFRQTLKVPSIHLEWQGT